MGLDVITGGGRSLARTYLSCEIPVTGKKTGKFTNFGIGSRTSFTLNPDTARLGSHYPALSSESEQGICKRLQGISLKVSG